MFLVDSSAYVLAGPRPALLEEYEAEDDLAICPPVFQEILQGAGRERHARIRAVLSRLIMLESPVKLERFEEAATLYYQLREQAITIRKSFDCLIAAIAIHHDAVILHHDRDFDYIARGSTLRAIDINPSASPSRSRR